MSNVNVKDFYTVHDSLEAAKAAYESVLNFPLLHSASITQPVASTDYDSDRYLVVWCEYDEPQVDEVEDKNIYAVHVLWGENTQGDHQVERQTGHYDFDTHEAAVAFMQGVQLATGWMDASCVYTDDPTMDGYVSTDGDGEEGMELYRVGKDKFCIQLLINDEWEPMEFETDDAGNRTLVTYDSFTEAAAELEHTLWSLVGELGHDAPDWRVGLVPA